MSPHILRASSHRPYDVFVLKTRSSDSEAPVMVNGRLVMGGKLEGQSGIRCWAWPTSINSRMTLRAEQDQAISIQGHERSGKPLDLAVGNDETNRLIVTHP